MKRILFCAIAAVAFTANVSFAQCCGSSNYTSANVVQSPMYTTSTPVVYQQPQLQIAPVQFSNMTLGTSSCCGQAASYSAPVTYSAPTTYMQPMTSTCCGSNSWSQPQIMGYSVPFAGTIVDGSSQNFDSSMVGSPIYESSTTEMASEEGSSSDDGETTEQTFTSNREQNEDFATDSGDETDSGGNRNQWDDANQIPAATDSDTDANADNNDAETNDADTNAEDNTRSFDINGDREDGVEDVDTDVDTTDTPFDAPSEDTE